MKKLLLIFAIILTAISANAQQQIKEGKTKYDQLQTNDIVTISRESGGNRTYFTVENNASQKENIISYNKLLNEDSDLPRVNSLQMKEYMDIANGAYSDFASPKLKEILASTGLIYHPEVIKLFYKIGDLSQEDNLSHYGTPPIEELTPAQILYGTKN